MKTKITILLTFLLAPLMAQTPAPRTVTLTWNDTNTGAVTWTAFRAPLSCTTAQSTDFVSLASAIAVKSYVDSAVTTGSTYCYYVVAVINTLSSAPSNKAGASVNPNAPTLNVPVVARIEVTVRPRGWEESTDFEQSSTNRVNHVNVDGLTVSDVDDSI